MARAAVDTAGVEAAVAEVVILRAAVEAVVAQVVIVEAAVVGIVPAMLTSGARLVKNWDWAADSGKGEMYPMSAGCPRRARGKLHGAEAGHSS